MLVLVGASASGKTQLAKMLMKHHQFKKLVTTTTRPMREGERDGIDYHFLTLDAFLSLEEEGAFLEATHYHDHWYGIQKVHVFKDSVVIVDPQGANVLKSQLGSDAFIVFVNTAETLREARMLKRGDAQKAVQERLLLDREHFAFHQFDTIDYTLQNNTTSLQKNAHHLARVYHSNQPTNTPEKDERH